MMSRRSSVLLVLVALGAVAVTLPLILPGDASLSRLRREGSIRIGYAVEPPYAFLKPDGEVTGESPENARHIVALMGIPHIEWRQVEFGDLIAELEAGRIDVIATGMFITAERARRVRFSEPTFRVGPGMLVARGNPKQLRTLAGAVARGDVRIAVIAGAVEEPLLQRMGARGERLVIVPDALTGKNAVQTGVADVLVLSSPTVRWMASRERPGRTEMVMVGDQPEATPFDGYGYGAYAFRPRDRDLLAAWNAAARSYLGGAEHRGVLARFGVTRAERGPGLPGAVH
jgi:polar amino acid transport system substrate-binding protein